LQFADDRCKEGDVWRVFQVDPDFSYGR
jgi:hypothetical protein